MLALCYVSCEKSAYQTRRATLSTTFCFFTLFFRKVDAVAESFEWRLENLEDLEDH